MADGRVDVDTETLRTSAASYDSRAEAIRRAGLNFGNVLSSYDPAFGDDSAGREIRKQFSTLSRGFLDGIHLFATAVDGTADGITALSRQYERVEERNTRLSTVLGSDGLGDPNLPRPGGPGQHGPGGPGSGSGNHGRGRH